MDLKIMGKRKSDKNVDRFEELAQSLNAHPLNAQILIEVSSKRNSLRKALAVLKGMDIEAVEHYILQKGDPSCVLLRLSAEDMREAVFRLSEAGFIKLAGINPQKG